MSGIKGYTVEEVARIAKEKLISDYEFCKGNLAKIRQREKEIADIRLDYNSKIARYRIESVDRVLDFIRSEYKAGRVCDLEVLLCHCQNKLNGNIDFTREPISITKPIRLIELFAGYGSQAMALKRIGAKFEHYRVVEFDKYAIASYNAVHGTDFPTMDITKVHAEDLNICDTNAFTYLLTYSFPCTDLSVAGKQAGMSKGSGTRSGLLWEVERILTEIRDSNGELPQILFMENVPQVHGKKNINDFEKWLGFLESLGYTNYWQDLNAKNYGVAQNRNRCFMFSFLGNYSYDFPQPIPLKRS